MMHANAQICGRAGVHLCMYYALECMHAYIHTCDVLVYICFFCIRELTQVYVSGVSAVGYRHILPACMSCGSMYVYVYVHVCMYICIYIHI
jgi:hypothetical protein